LTPCSGAAVLRKKTLLHLQMRQRFHVFLYGEDDIAATAAVSTVRTAFGNVLFTAKGDRSGASMARPNQDLRFIYKQGLLRDGLY
jgi:hypothetical protein